MATQQPDDDGRDDSTDDDSHATRREVLATGAGLATVATSGVASADESDETGEETADTWEWSGPVELGEMTVTHELTPEQWARAREHYQLYREHGYDCTFDLFLFNHSTVDTIVTVDGRPVDPETGEVQ